MIKNSRVASVKWWRIEYVSMNRKGKPLVWLSSKGSLRTNVPSSGTYVPEYIAISKVTALGTIKHCTTRSLLGRWNNTLTRRLHCTRKTSAEPSRRTSFTQMKSRRLFLVSLRHTSGGTQRSATFKASTFWSSALGKCWQKRTRSGPLSWLLKLTCHQTTM